MSNNSWKRNTLEDVIQEYQGDFMLKYNFYTRTFLKLTLQVSIPLWKIRKINISAI